MSATAYDSYEAAGISLPYGRRHGNVKLTCPKCSATRGNPRDRSLSVNLDKGVWCCHHCQWSGYVGEHSRRKDEPARKYRRPQPRPQSPYSDRFLAYFRSRGISESTLVAMKVGEGDEFMPQVQANRNTIQFNYYLNDELVNIKFRDGKKNFKMCRDAELIPYNINGIEGQSRCIITEGEMDALSFVEAGIPYVVSVPAGANANLSFLDNFIDGYFDDKEVVYIASDNDEKGRILRDELVRRLGAERCRLVEYGGCKDANELLQKNGTQALIDALERSEYVPVSGVFTSRDYADELDALYHNGLQKGMGIGFGNFDDICTFETRRLVVVTGTPGSGKSEFLDEICVRLNLHYGFKSAFFSPENMPLQLHAAKWIEKITGEKLEERSMTEVDYREAKDYIADNFFHIVPEGEYTLTNILSLAGYLVRRRGIRALVIDPYNRVESERTAGQTETEYISKFIDKLSNFAIQNDCIVFLMAHPRKPDLKNPNYVPSTYDIAGSAHFFNKCDYSLIVDRHRKEGYTDVIVEKVKFRHLGQGGTVQFKYDSFNGRYAPWEKEGPEPIYDRRNYLHENPFEAGPPQRLTVADILRGMEPTNVGGNEEENYMTNIGTETAPF